MYFLVNFKKLLLSEFFAITDSLPVCSRGFKNLITIFLQSLFGVTCPYYSPSVYFASGPQLKKQWFHHLQVA